MDVLYDRSDTIRESYRDVQFTMALTLALVIMVIYVFLRNVWATVIPSLALPFSIIGTFAVMYMLDYSLDNLSMMALILSVGFVVDDAIVMLENIYRHVEMGEDPLTASLVGIARDRLHDRVDDAVARGGVHPGAVHGRRARPPVPRVLGHDLRRDSHLRRGLGDAHADAVQPFPETQASRGARRRARAEAENVQVRRGHRKGVRQPAPRLRSHAEGGPPAPRDDDDGVRDRAPADGRALHPGAERLHPGAGHRSDRGHDGGRAGHGVRQARGIPGQGRRRDPREPERRRPRLDDRRQRGEHARRPQPRTDRGAPEAAQRAQRAGQRHHREAAAGAREHRRHAGLHAEPADGAHRRAGQQEPVSVLDAVARSRTAVCRVTQGKEGARSAAGDRGSDERPRSLEPAG